MKERPILFSAPMVRALLDGTKTQTRRIVKPQPSFLGAIGNPNQPFVTLDAGLHKPIRCPYGQPGDRLYVRETWAETDLHDGTPVVAYRAGGCIPVGRNTSEGPDFLIHKWAQPDTTCCEAWKPSIHMPRWASRITLEITGVRVERLQDISKADAIAEGIESLTYGGETTWRDYSLNDEWAAVSPMLYHPIDSYESLWESINGPGSWDANPFVWIVEFKRVEAA